MISGVDFGSSLVKAVWLEDGNYKFSSTASKGLGEIVGSLRASGISKVNAAGIGFSKHASLFQNFELAFPQGDAIQAEIKLQADGVKRLLGSEVFNGKSFLLVSIGTGTSYTKVSGSEAVKFPLGSSLGGGFINGLAKVFGCQNYGEFALKSASGTPLDLLVKDALPQTAGSFQGELVIASFGKAGDNSNDSNTCASAVSTVAVSTIRDVMILDMVPSFQGLDDVVFIGSTVSNTPLLKGMLEVFSNAIGKQPHFPENGEFSLAIGALHMQE